MIKAIIKILWLVPVVIGSAGLIDYGTKHYVNVIGPLLPLLLLMIVAIMYLGVEIINILFKKKEQDA